MNERVELTGSQERRGFGPALPPPDAAAREGAHTSGDIEREARRRMAPHRQQLPVSFDIDGTMEFGDPPGPILTSVVRALVGCGYIVGSASDRVVSNQER